VPRGDGTGPTGQGPGTGRGMGRGQGHLRQGRAEIVSVRTAEQQFLMLPDSPVTQEAAPNVVQE